jgi:hypothetical protein
MFSWPKRYKIRVSGHCSFCIKNLVNIEVEKKSILALKFMYFFGSKKATIDEKE